MKIWKWGEWFGWDDWALTWAINQMQKEITHIDNEIKNLTVKINEENIRRERYLAQLEKHKHLGEDLQDV